MQQIKYPGHWLLVFYSLLLCLFLRPVDSLAEPIPHRYSLHFSAGSPTGFYYAFATHFCASINIDRTEHGIRCSVAISAGSVENIKNLASATSQLGLAQNDVIVSTKIPNDSTNKNSPKLRTLFSLNDELFMLALVPEYEQVPLQDLPWEKIHLGADNSGTKYTALEFFRAMGVSPAKLDKSQHYSPLLLESNLKSGDSIGFFMVSGGKSKWLINLSKSVPFRFATLDGGDNRSDAIFSSLKRSVISGGIYAGNPEDTATMGVKFSLLITSEVPDAVIDPILERFFGRLNKLQELHWMFRDLNQIEMLSNPILPFHPQALRFYQKRGWIDGQDEGNPQ